MTHLYRTDFLLLISIVTLLILLFAGAFPTVTSAAQSVPASKTAHNNYSGTAPGILLSPEEKKYLERLGPITVCPDPDWLPYEQMDKQGNFTGIAADLMKLLSERLGIRFTYIHARDWDEAVALSQAGKVLLLPFLNQTPKREQWLTFTEPLFFDPNVFITRAEHAFITDAALLGNEIVAVPSGTAMEEKIRHDYPNLKLLNSGSSEAEVFQAIAERRADLTLRSLTVSAYTIRKGGWFNLKIAGQAPEEYTNQLRIGVLKSEPMLRDILNKGIATITSQEREEITNRHVNITVVKPVDYGLLLRIAGALAALIGLSFYWNLRLKRSNTALQESECSKSVLIEKLEKSLAAEHDARARQERFVAMISHEYRTPLAIIRGNLDIIELKERSKTGDHATELSKMNRAVNRLVEVMDRSLAKSRIADSHITVVSQVIQIDAFMASLLDYARALWPEYTFLSVEPDFSVTVNGEPEYLKTALLNLLDNARKYSLPDTPITITCRTEVNELLISIHNQGVGITPAEIERIFEKYQRGSSSSNTSGAGIGLWLVREIVTQHGGSIALKGAASGVEATVRLPLA